MSRICMEVRYNVIGITSLMTFASVKGGINDGCKDVYFVRCIGHDKHYLNDIEKLDKLLFERESNGQGRYIRAMDLPNVIHPQETLFYTSAYDAWENSGRKKITLKANGMDGDTETMVAGALDKICRIFMKYARNVSTSIQKNFIIKILYWLDAAVNSFFCNWNEKTSCKFVYSGVKKRQEYLFLYFLTLLGIDVLILAPEGEPMLDKPLLDLSYKLQLPTYSAIHIPAYEKSKYENKPQKNVPVPLPGQSGIINKAESVRGKVDLHRPVRNRTGTAKSHPPKAGIEKSFEELAMLASSIVMIAVHDQNGTVTGTGSGIMIGAAGYILTNHHVSRGGSSYSVRMEGAEEIYQTDELIKYNPLLDLALIRIEKALNPISIYRGAKELVRGQRVVAIGSPLGLFNSISDGIISGFRMFDDVEMIQFTAPISHGSSGGAVLNMHGEVIGISTAGIDSGQNINLAVNYKDINNFVRGFIKI